MKIADVVVALAVFIAGHVYFFLRFKAYRRDPTPSFDFDSERDRQIVARQKIAMMALCATAPILTSIVTLVLL
jgi:hypothetical protein